MEGLKIGRKLEENERLGKNCSGYTWEMAALLDDRDVEYFHHHRTSYWTMLVYSLGSRIR